MIESLSVSGLRGFSRPQEVRFAIPNGKPGSGLTIIVGANNSGKSSLVESITSFALQNRQQIPREIRNKATGHRILVRLQILGSGMHELATSKDDRDLVDNVATSPILPNLYPIPSRRRIAREIQSNTPFPRHGYSSRFPPTRERSEHGGHIQSRFLTWEKNRAAIDPLFYEILNDTRLSWTISSLVAGGQKSFVIQTPLHEHTLEGCGDGMTTVLHVIDALYEMQGDMQVLIDEPEQSLHPTVQKRLFAVLKRFSSTAQIIYATHSPHFIDWESLANGAQLVRTAIKDDAITVHHLSRDAVESVSGAISAWKAPHMLGTDAKEVFFHPDSIVVCEGQEDVALYKTCVNADRSPDAEFYGWGASGAGNIPKICAILRSLGFDKVFGIVDGDQPGLFSVLRRDFPNYSFHLIPTPDVRDKLEGGTDKVKKAGLFSENGTLKPEHVADVDALFAAMTSYFGKRLRWEDGGAPVEAAIPRR